MRARLPLITGLIVSLALLGQAPAHAADSGDVAAGVVLGAVVGGVIASHTRPVRVYEPEPVYYSPPPVAYYPPQPVYYEPRPVYYTSGPVYYVPRHHRHGHGHRHHHRHHDRRW
ncbi:hypothetical protein F3I16_06380 [Pseudomonas sp. L-22-4S-12]|uniref:hypothetical protein n=1 Tax=Pseudomonas sp. L-22-4S-12 TaxID=2610893 RepID=UPI00132168E9|nr:hypothetical protein [Pseudomonas sp. L-22-4S-12]MWV15675.1 hypothetical protein [Pseudomonas sp. L-22-4S-12]